MDGFYSEFSAGSTLFMMMDDDMNILSESDFGFGYSVGLGYDLSGRPTGFGLSTELRYVVFGFEGEIANAVMLMLNLAWK